MRPPEYNAVNPKIFVGVAIAAVAAGIVVVMTVGPSVLEGSAQPGQEPRPLAVLPMAVSVDEIRTVSLNSRGAVLELVVTVTNPNAKSAILSLVKYQVFADEERVVAGQIGSRAEGMVDASNYYTVLSGSSVTLKDAITLTNAGGAPEFWAALESGSVSWRVSGEAFFNLSSMTSGQENEVLFDQVLN